MSQRLTLTALLTFAVVVTLYAQPTARVPYYGARLEPRQAVLHGAGQAEVVAVAEYTKSLSAATRPILFMDYAGLNSPKIGNQLRSILTKCRQFSWFVIPQIGLSMTTDGQPDKHYEGEVAAGRYDALIDTLVQTLKRYDRPIYLRIGYEFNGHWNGYQPATYQQAFRHIYDRLRAANANNVATVWCYGPDSETDTYAAFYPGDDVVDWWGIDLFKPASFTYPSTIQFLADARQHRKPVMIGESTPKFVGVSNGKRSWETWFRPYFALVQANPHIKAFCYINWNWARFDYWKDWGDARVGQNAYINQHYQRAIRYKRIAHGADRQTTEALLSGK
ncbi:glycoside hydrolase family 26 protein [Fibrella aquatilis]|uniref:GH26 domain-containing protein n=1 Tax=Fibrella aquatilis TaxID=2817059 RepID=A0A939G7W8_9BACT|nr:glycosyl hydrolase [Fibrella aquatilis]MBO0932010.1 hypothetical protein [Fibrella aquatilis]